MNVLSHMESGDYEEVVFCQDRTSGLKAIIAIHDTTLGPALGGIRMFPYAHEEEALLDVLLLAKAMTLKASLAGLNFGGGKCVLMGNPQTGKNEFLFRTLGRFIDGLCGRYIPTEDMGTTTRDLEYLRIESRFGVGLEEAQGGGGDPSPMTAWGVYQGIRACLGVFTGREDLRGRTLAIQGIGKVGYALARYAREAGAEVVVADVDKKRLEQAKVELGVRVVAPEEILEEPCDVLAPCARGGILNPTTIPKLRCSIIAGGANNQLASDEDGDELQRRGILYAPDFAINAGGLINVADELGPGGYRRERAKAKTEEIYHTLRTIFAEAQRRGTAPHRVALALAQERIERAKRLRKLSSL